MPRRSAKVLLETSVDKNKRIDQILESSGIWAVLYDSNPINIRNVNQLFKYENIKYKKSNFSNPGPAIHLARKLNHIFKTDKFTVIKMTASEQIYPPME